MILMDDTIEDRWLMLIGRNLNSVSYSIEIWSYNNAKWK